MKKIVITSCISLSLVVHATAHEPQNMKYSSIFDNMPCSKQEKSKIFEHDCLALQQENAKIPRKSSNFTRIITYNVHAWTDCFWKNTFNQIIATLKDLSADIILIEEAQWGDPEIAKIFADLGYIYQDYYDELVIPTGMVGNAILSKIPFSSATHGTYVTPPSLHPVTGIPDPRSYVKVTMQLADQRSATLYCTHLDLFDESDTTRLSQVNELINHSANDITDLVIIGADCNAVRKKDYPLHVWERIKEYRGISGLETQTKALEAFESADFIDSFALSNQKAPGFTVWSGIAIDFLWTQKKSDKHLVTQSYVYYDAASDHIPVIMDIYNQ